jgi:CheY-specific phosphatase CheX
MKPLPSAEALHRFGGNALTEVLLAWLQFPATELASGSQPATLPEPALLITVTWHGDTLSGAVQLVVPDAFANHAAQVLLGSDSAAPTDALRRDLCGELANIVAGRIAADLRSAGHSSTLGTPTVTPISLPFAGDAHSPDSSFSVWRCQGFPIGLHVRCQPSPA